MTKGVEFFTNLKTKSNKKTHYSLSLNIIEKTTPVFIISNIN